MSTSKTTTKLGLPLPQPGDKPDWYDLGAAGQSLEGLFGAANGFATLDKDGNAVQMPAGAVPNTRKILGNPLSGDITLAQLISAGLCPAPVPGTFTPTLYGFTTAGTPTYVFQNGFYYKLGKLVVGKLGLKISNLGGAAGNILVSSLPSTPSYGNAVFSIVYGINIPTGTSLLGHIDGNGITLMHTGNGGNDFVIETGVTNSLEIDVATFWYVEN